LILRTSLQYPPAPSRQIGLQPISESAYRVCPAQSHKRVCLLFSRPVSPHQAVRLFWCIAFRFDSISAAHRKPPKWPLRWGFVKMGAAQMNRGRPGVERVTGSRCEPGRCVAPDEINREFRFLDSSEYTEPENRRSDAGLLRLFEKRCVA
jgi:hypothetical protein